VLDRRPFAAVLPTRAQIGSEPPEPVHEVDMSQFDDSASQYTYSTSVADTEKTTARQRIMGFFRRKILRRKDATEQGASTVASHG